MTYEINASKLGSFAPKSNSRVYLSKEAEQETKQTYYELKKLWYGARKVAWGNRNRRQVWLDAASSGELKQFELNTPGIRQKDGSYSKGNKYDLDKVNLYLWNKFCQSWAEAVPLDNAKDLKTYKDLKNASLEIVKFAYKNWGHILIEDYQPECEPLEEKCTFNYYIEENDIKVKGKFTPEKREIILSSEGVNDITIIQTKGKNSWKAGIHFNSENSVMNSRQALQFSKMLELASRLNIQIKQFMENPEEFLGVESAKTLNQIYIKIKERLLEVNDSYLAERNQAKKDENQLTIKEEIVGDSSQTPKIKHEVRKKKQTKQQEAEKWLLDNPEFNEDFDSALGISQIELQELKELGCQVQYQA